LSPKLVRETRVHGVLLHIDEDLGAQVRSQGCSCGGKLHSARYPRKPRGVPDDLAARHGVRLSFCCARDGCRRRVTPASVRFLGRRVYLGIVVVLLAVLAHGATARRLGRLRAVLGEVSERTLARWRRWWREAIPSTDFWREHGARHVPPVVTALLPGSLLARFRGEDDCARLVAMMRFLAPLTTRILPSQARSAMAVAYPQRTPMERR
jgi:hypothetical protein